jgi:hypothetical protein
MPRYAADNSMREKQLNIRLSPEEAQRLEFIAEHYSLSAAAVLRMLVKREHDALRTQANSFGPAPKRAKAPK